MTDLQRSPTWYAARRNRITASMVGAILGLSPFMTRADAMRAMVREREGAPSEFNGNIATEYGTHNESGAIIDYELETGNDVVPEGFVPYEDWLGASPDGYVGKDGLIEVKCPFSLRNDPDPIFKTVIYQPHYYAQAQIQIFVTGRKWCDFWQWAPHGRKLERIGRDQSWFDTNLPILRQFYAEFLAEPAEEHLAPLRVTIDTPAALKLLAEYDSLCEQIDLAEEHKKELFAQIVALSPDGKDALICGRKLTLIERAGAISYAKAIKSLLPDADLEQWRGKPMSFWKLT